MLTHQLTSSNPPPLRLVLFAASVVSSGLPVCQQGWGMKLEAACEWLKNNHRARIRSRPWMSLILTTAELVPLVRSMQ